MVSWFETHAHLSDPKFDSDRDAVIKAALDADVKTLIEIADGPEEWDKAQKLTDSAITNIYWSAGLHPYYADKLSPDVLNRLASFVSHPKFVALGELGLDYAKSTIEVKLQKNAFCSLMDLALSLKKPVILHCRNAFVDLISILKSRTMGDNPGVVHCFTGSLSDAECLIDMGFMLGVDAPITYPSAKNLRQTLKNIPLERLVLETDSPYLPPQRVRGLRNEPKYIPLIAEELALLKDISIGEVKRVCHENSKRLFRLSHI